MTTLQEPTLNGPANNLRGRIVITDIDGHGVRATRRDGEAVTVAEITAAAHYMGTQIPVPGWPSYADRHQLARVIAGLMDVGCHVFGPGFAALVARYGDPNDDMGSGAPELGGYQLNE